MKPAPYPSDTKAKGWRLELDMEQFRQSDTWALASAPVKPWLLMLWAVAWEQVPCGSLPSDDELIAARLGLDLESFMTMKRVLMRGWWQAEDGRFYHDVMVSRVSAMLEKKDKDRMRKAGWRSRQSDGIQASHTDVPRDSTVADDTKHQAPSTSTSSLRSEVKPPRASRKAARTHIPEDFGVSDAVKSWAEGKGYGDLNAHLEAFRDKARANGYTYLSWDDAFKNAIREDWGKVRERGVQPRASPSKPPTAAQMAMAQACPTLVAPHLQSYAKQHEPTYAEVINADARLLD